MRSSVRRQTQNNLAPYGNCWQTAVACVLGIEAEALPPQSDIERMARSASHLDFGGHANRPAFLGWLSYRNALNRYLAQHHGLGYASAMSYLIGGIRVISCSGYHVICGPSPRTARSGINHCVVGRRGDAVWDPHPSRVGLIGVNEWGIVAPLPDGWEPTKMHRELPCLCNECGGVAQLVLAARAPAPDSQPEPRVHP